MRRGVVVEDPDVGRPSGVGPDEHVAGHDGEDRQSPALGSTAVVVESGGVAVTPAGSAVFEVDRTDDVVLPVGSPSDGARRLPLRTAIHFANVSPGPDEILLPTTRSG